MAINQSMVDKYNASQPAAPQDDPQMPAEAGGDEWRNACAQAGQGGACPLCGQGGASADAGAAMPPPGGAAGGAKV